MKIFKSESKVDYSTYTFNYAVYCLKERRDDIPKIYDLGFLPYSNDTELNSEVYYLARSLRVNLCDFSDSSENRRVIKKIAEKKAEMKVIPVDDFNINDEQFISFCKNFADKRFSEKISEKRMSYILNNQSISHVFRFSFTKEIVGYVICIIEQGTLHYWFSFFSLEHQTYSLGKWMMYSVINWAKEQNLDHVYLGTCYGEKSLYKVRDFKGLSFFDGNNWNKDIKLLKAKCKSDASFSSDDFKQDTDLFLERIDS